MLATLLGFLTASLTPLDCMAYNAYHEDRMYGTEAMRAVSWVVLNRANDIRGRWPRDVCKVVFQPSRKPVGHPEKCAFSWTCDDLSDELTDTDSELLAYQAASSVLYNETHLDPTMGALYYFRCELMGTQGWMRNIVLTVKIEDHCYYRDK